MRRWLAVVWVLAFAAAAQGVQPGQFFTEGDKTKNAAALTFDDGPGEFTLRILDVLDQHQVKATFFMNGDQVELRPKIAQEVLKRGHEIADHTYSHTNFHSFEKRYGAETAKKKIRNEMKMSMDAIEKATGVKVTLTRMPHGYHRPWMKDIAKEMNVSLVNWTFGEDWLNIPKEKMLADYVKHLRPGAILLFHDGGRKRDKTLENLPALIQQARAKNLSLVPVGQILK